MRVNNQIIPRQLFLAHFIYPIPCLSKWWFNCPKAIPTDVKCFVRGKVTDTEGKPLGGAQLEVWQCNSAGFYSQQADHDGPEFNLRGTFITDDEGNYSFECLRPTLYPIPYDGPAGDLLKIMDRHPNRPSHIHWRVSHQGIIL